MITDTGLKQILSRMSGIKVGGEDAWTPHHFAEVSYTYYYCAGTVGKTGTTAVKISASPEVGNGWVDWKGKIPDQYHSQIDFLPLTLQNASDVNLADGGNLSVPARTLYDCANPPDPLPTDYDWIKIRISY